MPSTQGLLKIVAVDNFNQTFGSTEYATFKCETESRDSISVAVSHNALTARGVDLNLLDSLLGSTLIVQDDTDIVTKVFHTGQDRIAQIVDGTLINPRTGKPSSMLMLNKANSTLLKADLYIAETKDLASSSQAKYQVEKEKERKLEQARKSRERIQVLLSSPAMAELEMNENPF
jgi:hypothetical protein